MGKVAIVAFAFGQQKEKLSGPSNDAIGKVSLSLQQGLKDQDITSYIVTQWEVDLYLQQNGWPSDCVVSSYDLDRYIDTKAVIDRATDWLRQKDRDVDRLFLVAQPAHLYVIKQLYKFKLWKPPTGFGLVYVKRAIPFDRSKGNIQWWTKNRAVFYLYLAKTLVTKRHGSSNKTLQVVGRQDELTFILALFIFTQ